jgi:hypothetical protein
MSLKESLYDKKSKRRAEHEKNKGFGQIITLVGLLLPVRGE